jgi:hypothetical protein
VTSYVISGNASVIEELGRAQVRVALFFAPLSIDATLWSRAFGSMVFFQLPRFPETR